MSARDSIRSATGRPLMRLLARFGLAGDADVERAVRWMAGASALATAIWLWLQLDLLDQRVFSNFYDIQARALLDGDLAVPTGSLGNEAFVARGHEFLYNPPGPSLLRVPVFLVTDRFDGRLTTLSMLAAWVLTLVLSAAFVWRVRRLVRGQAPLPTWEAAGYGVLVASFSLGSVLVYLGAVPWVFHEAYAWSVPMAIGTVYALVGLVERSSTRAALAVGGFVLGAVLVRAPAGFACGAAAVATGGWIYLRQRTLTRPIVASMLAGVLPLLVGAAINWAKFRHPYALPIEDQVFTSLSATRRAMIDATGDGFAPVIAKSTVPAYFRPDGIRFSALFPFIDLPAHPPAEAPGVVLDRSYRTGSIVSFMPLLVGLAVWGLVSTYRRGTGAIAAARVPLIAALLVPLPILFGAYIAHRYTAEFMPLLVTAGSIGAVDVARRLPALSRDPRRVALTGLGALAAFGIVANLAVAVGAQALANPGPTLDHLVRMQDAFGHQFGDPLREDVVASVALPEEGAAGHVQIIGSCQAFYVGTGEDWDPWTEIGTREVDLTFRASGPPAAPASLPFAEITGLRRSTVSVERSPSGIRLTVVGGGVEASTDWHAVGPDGVRVSIETGDPEDYSVRLGELDPIRVPKESLDENFYAQPNVLVPIGIPEGVDAPTGLTAEVHPTAPLTTCEPLLEAHLEEVASRPS